MSSRQEHSKLQFACGNVFLVAGGDKNGAATKTVNRQSRRS
jgi:hypothetical protein